MRSRLRTLAVGLCVASGLVACGDPARPTLELEAIAATVSAVPPAPVPGRIGHVAVWTGAEMVIWGGVGRSAGSSAHELADGAAYDPSADTWRVLAPSPLSPRSGAAAVWAGDQLFVWGGSTPYSSEAAVLGDGALYDPVADAWTPLPAAPLDARTGAAAVWTGTEIVLFGGVRVPSTEQQQSDGAAYNPSTGRWRAIEGAPLPEFYEFGAVWTGTDLVVLAGTFDAATNRPVGAAYTPTTDRWRPIDDPPLQQGYAQDLGWDGTEVVVAYPVPSSGEGTSNGTTAAAYDPLVDSWRELPRPATQPSWGVPIWTGDAMAYWDAAPAGGVAYLADEEAWVALPAVEGPNREFPSLVWTGSLLIAWGGNDNCETSGGGAADCELDLLDDGHSLQLG